MPEIVLRHVTKKFQKSVAVEDLNLTIDNRGFITLLGPSGCGKTTTLRMIAGLESPTAGEISIGGRLVFSSEQGIDLPPDQRDVGFLFQNYALWPHMTVYQNITFGLENMKWDKVRMKERADELMTMLRIADYGARYPAELSGGQQQRVAIARTLATGPKTLFMDEPLSNLDAKLRMEMRTELKRLHRETDSTFVYVTHDQLEAMTLSTKICLLREGKLQQYAPPLEVYNYPVNVFAADFIGSPNINLLPVTVGAGTEPMVQLVLASGQTLPFRLTRGVMPLAGQTLRLGIRPENVLLAVPNGLPAQIVATLPSGMETVVRLDMEGTPLTAVVFGTIDFAVGQTVQVGFKTDGHILFMAESGDCIAGGEVKV